MRLLSRQLIDFLKRAHGPTDLHLTNWSRARLTSLAITSALYLAIISATLWASVEWWSGMAASPAVGVAFAAGVDGLAVVCLLLRICRVGFALNPMRHVLPATTAPAVWTFTHAQFSNSLVAGACTALMIAVAFVLQRSLEGMFVGPEELARERVAEAAQALLNEQHRHHAVLGVMGGFAQESKRVSVKPVRLLGDGQERLTNPKWGSLHDVPGYRVPEARRLQEAGDGFDHLKRKR